MPKRYSNTDKWNDLWYRGLQPNTKVILEYIWDTCDPAGIWEFNTLAAEQAIGFAPSTINWKSVYDDINRVPEELEFNSGKGDKSDIIPRVSNIQRGKWWMVHYVKEQYQSKGVLYLTKNPRAVTITRSLSEHGLIQTFLQYFPNSISTELLVNPNAKLTVLNPVDYAKKQQDEQRTQLEEKEQWAPEIGIATCEDQIKELRGKAVDGRLAPEHVAEIRKLKGQIEQYRKELKQ